MARKAGKGYQPTDTRTATFKLSHQKWEDFQSICRGQNRSASDVLLEFVESVLEDESIPTKDDGVQLAIANLQDEIAAINARLDALASKDEVLPPAVEMEPLQGIVEGEEISQPKPVETVDLLKKFEDGRIYSQSDLAKILGCQSIQIKSWIVDGISPKDARHQAIIPHISFSHTDGKNRPNFYRFSLTPQGK